MIKQDTILLVTNILKTHLEKNHLRKTPERFAILKEIYTNCFAHFSIDSLYSEMKEKNIFTVTMTTLYNTMSVLVDAGLVVKHQFGDNKFIYEKKYQKNQHDHLICSNCGDIIEFNDNTINTITEKVSNKYKFKIDYHSLCYYGLCSNCQKKELNNE